MKHVFRLNGSVQHYEWGGREMIPALLKISNPSLKPFAEYWMGTHPRSPSMVVNGADTIPLSSLTEIPFLLKILDVSSMLSIQVHPSKKAAEIEFARENNERIPLDAPNRNYRDPNHKPELLVALSDFWLLHGFKNVKDLEKILHAVPEFDSLLPVFENEGYEGLYKKVMGMPQEVVDKMLTPLLQRIVPLYQAGVLKKNEEDHWAAKASITFNNNGSIDRGIFSIYFFNIVLLKKEEGLFQAAGVPHAYLEGQCVEIMSNSDNVLRGGLTAKHVDVKELLKHVICEPVIPDILRPVKKGEEMVYKTPVEDFELSIYKLSAGTTTSISSPSAVILIVLEGEIQLSLNDEKIALIAGQSAVILPSEGATIQSEKDAVVYKATSSTI